MVDFTQGAPVPGDLDVAWIHGVPRGTPDPGPPIQVHAYDEHTLILRQSKTTSFEAPFLYLLFGNDRAVLFDTGATKDATTFPLRATVDQLVADWQQRHEKPAYELVVAHTHAHGDHVAGDGQFAGRADTTVVGTDLDAVQSFYGFTSWPDEVVPFDLGGRVLEVTGVPGHHPTAIAVFDPWTGFLLTGDSVYPGRLYAPDMPAFVASADRLVDFAAARPVSHVMGCHIEMTRTPGRDYPMGTKYQPDEPPLQMSPDRLRAVSEAAHAASGRPGMHVCDDFMVFNQTGPTAVPRLILRTLRQRLAARFSKRT
jgi:glyoxylase-like metal-dependent hydrolase (beta-lactamase superfamily II)